MLLELKGMPDVLALQHTGVASEGDAKRLTRKFGKTAVGFFALQTGRQNTYSTALIFVGGLEDGQIVDACGYKLTVEATVAGHRAAWSSVYLDTKSKQRISFLREWNAGIT